MCQVRGGFGCVRVGVCGCVWGGVRVMTGNEGGGGGGNGMRKTRPGRTGPMLHHGLPRCHVAEVFYLL